MHNVNKQNQPTAQVSLNWKINQFNEKLSPCNCPLMASLQAERDSKKSKNNETVVKQNKDLTQGNAKAKKNINKTRRKQTMWAEGGRAVSWQHYHQPTSADHSTRLLTARIAAENAEGKRERERESAHALAQSASKQCALLASSCSNSNKRNTPRRRLSFNWNVAHASCTNFTRALFR